jgi:hypothetical protein
VPDWPGTARLQGIPILKTLVTFLVLLGSAFALVTVIGRKISGTAITDGTSTSTVDIGTLSDPQTESDTVPADNLISPTLPQAWACAYILDDPTYCTSGGSSSSPITTTYTVIFPSSGSGGAWTCNLTNYGPYTAGSQTSLQTAFNNVEACRTATGSSITLEIPPGLYSGTNGIVIPQSNTSLATEPILVMSTEDSSLPNHQTVCSHGIQDNLAASTDPGLINPDCAGDELAYQLGTTVTAIPPGSFTFANGTASNTANFDDVQRMWTDECTGTNCTPLYLCSPVASGTSACASDTLAPDHWLIMDGEFRESVGNTGNINLIGMAGAGESSTSQLPSNVYFRKDWMHGDWTSLTAGANLISGGIYLNCITCALVDSQVSEALRPGLEGHAVFLQYENTVKIDHNWLEGQSIGVFCGGFTAVSPTIFGYVSCQNVELRRNRLTFPYAWLGVGTIPSGNAHWARQSIVRKNCTEFKEAERLLRDGNICENVDNSGGQGGNVTLLRVANSSASVVGRNYQAVTEDVTISDEIERNSCEGFTTSGQSGPIGTGNGASYPMQRVRLDNVLEYNIAISNPGCHGANSYSLASITPGLSWKGTITENSAGTAATFVATCSVNGGDCPSGPPSEGYEVFDIQRGTPVWISGCTTVTAFNVATQNVNGHQVPSGIGPLVTVGSTPWSGSFESSGVTVTYRWTAPANAVDSSGTCTLNNIEGAPQHFLIAHHTLITSNNYGVYNENIGSTGPAFALGNLLRNSIFLSGTNGWMSTRGEGNPTELWGYDYTSLTAYSLVWPARKNTLYNEYGNNPGFPDPNGCTGTGCTPPISMFFPTTSYCTGASPTSSCVGFKGALSTTSMPIVLNNYHGYELASGSIFKSGGSGQASDGTDQGANIPEIDNAQTQKTYRCASPCGSPGPQPD